MADKLRPFQSVRLKELPTSLKNDLRDLERYLRGIDDRIAGLTASEPINVNITGGGGSTIGAHAPTHRTGGTDPIDPFAFTWKNAHGGEPSTAALVPITITGHASQTADLFKSQVNDGTHFALVDDMARLSVNDATPTALLTVKGVVVGESDILAMSPDLWLDARDPLGTGSTGGLRNAL